MSEGIIKKLYRTADMVKYMVDNYAVFFDCTPVGRASDSMMAPT